MTDKEKLLGNLFRKSIYEGTTVPDYLETFARTIYRNFKTEDFLILQLASQLYESAQIRKNDSKYMNMQSIFTNEAFNYTTNKYPGIKLCVSQRFKSAMSELFKRSEKIFDEGRSPEIRDLIASKITILEEESQETISYEYNIAYDLMQHFSALNSSDDFPLYINLAIPDRQVGKSKFEQSQHPNIIIPNDDIIIKELSVLGKDYISNPKTHGYQAYHTSYELISKENPSLKIFSELQITTISQANYEPANHKKYKKKRNEKWSEFFSFDSTKVHIDGYYPQFDCDYSGLTEPLHVIEIPKTLI